MTEKITGYSLLILGLAIILIAGLNIYAVFTGQAQIIKLFNFPAISLELAKGVPMEVASADMVNGSINLFAHLFLVGFFVNVGYKISSLGIELIRPVVVKLKEEKL